MANIAIKSDKVTPFGGIFPIMEHLTSCFQPLLTQRWAGDAAQASVISTARLRAR